MAGTPIPRRKVLKILGWGALAGAITATGAISLFMGLQPEQPAREQRHEQTSRTEETVQATQKTVQATQVSQARSFSTLEKLAEDVSHRVGGKYVYSGNLPEHRYDEVDFDFLDAMLLNDAVMTGPDTGPMILERIGEARKELLRRMPADQQYLIQGADLSKGARLYLKYIPSGQAFSQSETYDTDNNSDLEVSVALYLASGEIVKKPLAPLSLKDLTYILNPKHEKEITWQVLDGSRIVYKKTLDG